MDQHHFLVCNLNGDNEQLENGEVHWIVPKTAKIGDKAFFFAGIDGIIARGIIKTAPNKQDAIKLGWENRYSSVVSEIEGYQYGVDANALIDKFPEWKWPTYPRSYNSVEEKLGEEIEKFIDATART